ncbi:hypothetical protein NHQ30_005595 [Ciborinia camelliae]|nr:hypothetical protein NHQ30_005595 [Ciborinia camelliae]
MAGEMSNCAGRWQGIKKLREEWEKGDTRKSSELSTCSKSEAIPTIFPTSLSLRSWNSNLLCSRIVDNCGLRTSKYPMVSVSRPVDEVASMTFENLFVKGIGVQQPGPEHLVDKSNLMPRQVQNDDLSRESPMAMTVYRNTNGLFMMLEDRRDILYRELQAKCRLEQETECRLMYEITDDLLAKKLDDTVLSKYFYELMDENKSLQTQINALQEENGSKKPLEMWATYSEHYLELMRENGNVTAYHSNIAAYQGLFSTNFTPEDLYKPKAMKLSTEMSELQGGCSCGRNKYTIQIPQNTAGAQVFFDSSNLNRRSQATPLSAWLRVPLAWYHSTTYAFFDDEPHNIIRRSYTSPTEQHAKRHFCGFCGTPLSYWTEEPAAHADYIALTLGSLASSDLRDLEELGLLPREALEDAQNEKETIESVIPPTNNNGGEQGLPWFETMVEGSRLGKMKTSRGMRAVTDGRIKVEWEIVEWTAEDDDTQTSTTGKRKLDATSAGEDPTMEGLQ